MLTATQGTETAVINTAYIERLNATFRARLAPLVRRSRATVRQVATLDAGMWLGGSVYNFVTPHRSLGTRTPAQAAGLTNHPWTIHELLTAYLSDPVTAGETTRATAALAMGDTQCCLTTVH